MIFAPRALASKHLELQKKLEKIIFQNCTNQPAEVEPLRKCTPSYAGARTPCFLREQGGAALFPSRFAAIPWAFAGSWTWETFTATACYSNAFPTAPVMLGFSPDFAIVWWTFLTLLIGWRRLVSNRPSTNIKKF